MFPDFGRSHSFPIWQATIVGVGVVGTLIVGRQWR